MQYCIHFPLHIVFKAEAKSLTNPVLRGAGGAEASEVSHRNAVGLQGQKPQDLRSTNVNS